MTGKRRGFSRNPSIMKQSPAKANILVIDLVLYVGLLGNNWPAFFRRLRNLTLVAAPCPNGPVVVSTRRIARIQDARTAAVELASSQCPHIVIS